MTSLQPCLIASAKGVHLPPAAMWPARGCVRWLDVCSVLRSAAQRGRAREQARSTSGFATPLRFPPPSGFTSTTGERAIVRVCRGSTVLHEGRRVGERCWRVGLVSGVGEWSGVDELRFSRWLGQRPQVAADSLGVTNRSRLVVHEWFDVHPWQAGSCTFTPRYRNRQIRTT